MARIDLETYYKNFFKEASYAQEEIKGINAAHAISSKYYDIQFGRNSIIYRDKNHKLNIPIEHDTDHTVVIYLYYYFENNTCDMAMDLVKKRIATILNFLKVKFQFE